MKLKERCLVSVVLAIRPKLGTALLTSALFKYGGGLDFFYERIRPDQTTTSVAGAMTVLVITPDAHRQSLCNLPVIGRGPLSQQYWRGSRQHLAHQLRLSQTEI